MKYIKSYSRPEIWQTICYLLPLSFFILTGCPDNNNDKDDKYDPRNVTRIDNHLEVQPELVVDSERNVHLVYHGGVYDEARDVYYIWKSETGEWSEPVNLSNSGNDSRVPQIAVDSQDNLHVIWEEDGEGNGRTIYTMKQNDGDWSEPEFITENGNPLPQIALDNNDAVHVIGMGNVYRKLYNGVWSDPEVTPYIHNPALAVSSDGDVHIANDAQPTPIFYYYKVAGGVWSDLIEVNIADDYSWLPDIAVDEDETVYISWTERYTKQIKIRMRYPDGSWSAIDSIPDMEGAPWHQKLAVDEAGLHLVWIAHTEEWDYDVYYQHRTHEGVWQERQQISNTTTESLGPGIYIDNDQLYIAWHEKFEPSQNSNRDIYYITVNLNNY